MHLSTFSASILLVTLSTASPIAENKPITDEQFARMSELGLTRRDGPAKIHNVNQPITPEQLATLKTLDKRGEYETRDKRKNCGQTILGRKAGGHGIWVPIDQYIAVAGRFCKDYATTDVYNGHEVSDTYAVTLTNQDDPSATGPPGNVVFGIFNTKMTPTYVITEAQCLDSMKKQSNDDSKCYGSKHKDTEGGYWNVDTVGVFGSEVYAA